RPLANDSFRASGTEKLKNWTGVGNDRFGELDGNFWLTMSDRLRCRPVPDCLTAANVSNMDLSRSIEGPLYGTPPSIR
ncbi:MAG: hypothetical protein PHH58_09755, partial [Rhodoferax sp.]|nr:hypothetical protein [Rhodoferax sp.]